MIRFMLCDTDTKFLDVLAAKLHQHYDPCKIEYLYGPDALEVSLRAAPGSNDILITEIELRGRSSIDIISDYLSPLSPLQVIYMTSKIEYCTEVYETSHCGFLLKPVQMERLCRTIDRALRELKRRRSSGLAVQRGGSLYIVDTYSLLYVEGRGRVARLVTEDGILETYEKLNDLCGRIDGCFVQSHKSYLVNMERVRQFNGDSFLMGDGVSIPISQSRRKEVRQQFLAFIRQADTRCRRDCGTERDNFP